MRRAEARKSDCRRHAGAQKTVEPLAVILQREDTVKAARRGDLKQALGVVQYRFGEKAAVREEAHGTAQRGGGGQDAMVGGGEILPQASHEMSGGFRVGCRRK